MLTDWCHQLSSGTAKEEFTDLHNSSTSCCSREILFEAFKLGIARSEKSCTERKVAHFGNDYCPHKTFNEDKSGPYEVFLSLDHDEN